MSKIPLGERIALRRAQDTADERYEAAAQAMLRALKYLADAIDAVDANWDSGGGRDLAGAVNNLDAEVAREAIRLAEEAGITTGDE